jgi:thioredoxin reductase (NADPH)
MISPILFLVAQEPAVLEALKTDLGRRFGNDCRILTARTPAEGLAMLRALVEQEAPVALLIADHRMPEMTGVEFLVQAHALHPSAKRILLVERDYTAANPIVPAMTLGQIDYHLVSPGIRSKGSIRPSPPSSRPGPARASPPSSCSGSSGRRRAPARTRSAIY